MTKWEYNWLLFDFAGAMDKIEELGLEGWELINIIEGKDVVRNPYWIAVLKRPQTSGETANE